MTKGSSFATIAQVFRVILMSDSVVGDLNWDVDEVLFSRLAPTSTDWFAQAEANISDLLNDHAACERKAAQFALAVANGFQDNPDVVDESVLIAREELRHYQQVQRMIKSMGLQPGFVSASPYAMSLRNCDCAHEVDVWLHRLVVASVIEGRSCERFNGLVSVLSKHYPSLSAFYKKLYLAEKRHALVYLEWARLRVAKSAVIAHLQNVLAYESGVINRLSPVFRFHSGPV